MRAPDLREHLATCGAAPAWDPMIDAVVSALERVPREPHLAQLPAPLPSCEPFPEGRLSPRLLVLLARALDPQGADRVLLIGEPLVALAASLHDLNGGPKEIVVAATNASRARWTARRMGLDATESLVIVDGADDIPRGAYDRILAYGVSANGLQERLTDDAILVHAQWDRGRGMLTTHVRLEGHGADIDVSKHWVGPVEPKRPRRAHRTPAGTTVGRLLGVERMQDNAWRGIAATPTEQGVLRAVRETFFGPGADDPLDEGHATDPRLARRLFHLGYLEQVAGTRPAAEALYRASLSVSETAEAWTFYGWVRSQAGALQEAVDACRRAIHLDETLGNPYNDIGAYLMAEGKTDEAKLWFQRATQAPRYAAPHYPYTNLGRVYLREGDLSAAREAVEHALERMPGYPPAERLLREIETREAHDPTMR